MLAGRNRTDPTLAVRLLRCYRETGRIDRARELAASLPSSPASWTPLDAARLAIERANLATIDGRADHAEAELRVAARALTSAPKGAGLREQLDLHVTQAQLEIKLDRLPGAAQALRLAEHVAERLDDVAWRAPVAMTLGHLSMRLSDPRAAARHYAAALSRTQARAAASMTAHGNLAIALGSIGRFEEGRHHASQAISIAHELAAGWRHADAHDVLAIVEIAGDRPIAALQAIDEALVVLGEIDHTMLRYQLAVHRTWALAMLGRAQSAKQWLARAEKLRGDLAVVDAIDEQDLVSTRARTLEASGQHREAIDESLPHVQQLPEAFVTGSLNLVVGRCALALGDEPTARLAGRASGALGRPPRVGLSGSRSLLGPLAARAEERRQPGGSLRREEPRARQRHERRDAPGAAAFARVRRSTELVGRSRRALRAHRGRDPHLRHDAGTGEPRSPGRDGPRRPKGRDARGRYPRSTRSACTIAKSRSSDEGPSSRSSCSSCAARGRG